MDVSVRVLNATPDYDVRFEEVRTRNGDVSKVQADFKFSAEQWFKRFCTEHSTIEVILIRVTFNGVSKNVRNQIIRATKQHPRYFVGSGRPDRNGGKPRDPDALEDFDMVLNPLAIINIARQRLCFMSEEPTREAITELKLALLRSIDPLLSSLGSTLVPNCVYRGSCPETLNGRDCYGLGVDVLGSEIIERYGEYDGTVCVVCPN